MIIVPLRGFYRANENTHVMPLAWYLLHSTLNKCEWCYCFYYDYYSGGGGGGGDG